jgi:hypothetical protein
MEIVAELRALTFFQREVSALSVVWSGSLPD